MVLSYTRVPACFRRKPGRSTLFLPWLTQPKPITDGYQTARLTLVVNASSHLHAMFIEMHLEISVLTLVGEHVGTDDTSGVILASHSFVSFTCHENI